MHFAVRVSISSRVSSRVRVRVKVRVSVRVRVPALGSGLQHVEVLRL